MVTFTSPKTDFDTAMKCSVLISMSWPYRQSSDMATASSGRCQPSKIYFMPTGNATRRTLRNSTVGKHRECSHAQRPRVRLIYSAHDESDGGRRGFARSRDIAALVAGAPAVTGWVGLRGPHLRSCLVSTALALRGFLSGVTGDPSWHLHGWHVSRKHPAASVHQPAPSSASRVRLSRVRNQRVRHHRARDRAVDWRRIHDDCGHGTDEPLLSRDRGGGVPAATNAAHGRHTSSNRQTGTDHAVWSVVARLLLRRESHRRRHAKHFE